MRTPTMLLPLLLLLVCATPGFAEDDKPAAETASIFGDAALLEKHLAEACDIVETLEQRRFEARPTIRVSTPDEVAAALVAEFEVMPESFIAKDQRETFANAIAKFLLAKYEPAKNLVHVVPSAIAMIEKAQPKLEKLGLDHLRVLLAHEVTHAMDFKRYDIMGMRATLVENDAQQALNAVVEGHAQFVAEKAAKQWKIMPAFERLTAAIVGSPEGEGTDTEKALRAAALAQIRFAYVEGHEFFRAVAKAQGSEGVDRAMREPPARSKLIEQPALWLDPSTATATADLKAIVTSLAWLAPAKGWVTVEQRVLANGLKAQAMRLPADRRAEWLQGFKDSHLWQGQDPSSGARVVAVVLQFDTPANATRFGELDQIIVENAKPQAGMKMDTKALMPGVGPEGRYPGFYMHRVVTFMGQEIDMRQKVLVHGAFALEMIVMNAKQIDRGHLDEAMTRVIAWIDDPAAAAKLPALETPTAPKEEPAEEEPSKAEPAKADPKKAEPKKAEPKKAEPAKSLRKEPVGAAAGR